MRRMTDATVLISPSSTRDESKQSPYANVRKRKPSRVLNNMEDVAIPKFMFWIHHGSKPSDEAIEAADI